MSRKYTHTFSEPGQVSRAGLLVTRGRVIAMASLLAVAPMVTGFPQVSSPAQAHPVKSHVHKVGFVKSSVTAMRTAKDATRSVVGPGAPDPVTTARAAAVTPVQDVSGAVTVVGVTWPKSATEATDTYQIRTLTGATWSRWQPLGHSDGGPDGAEAAATTTAGTDPYVVTGASKYEVRSLSADTDASTSATVQVVDPGASSADDLAQEPGAAAAATTQPATYTRADWGADESVRKGAPLYGQVQLAFVHHTVDANDYAAADVPAIIRGMYAYHVQTLGWDDIGYNFLIDRFGRTWEGRYGGMDKAVVGAQTLGYNSVSTGVAAIGDFDIAAVPQAVTDAFKQIFAWKLSLAGVPAAGASAVLAPDGQTALQRVSGHRDAVATTCPGQYLYASLPEIGAGADAIIGSLPAKPTAVAATAGDSGAAVSWTAPASAGGAAITGYTVTASPGGKIVATTGATTATMTGLTNGTAYTFTVTATSLVGESISSAASTAVTPTRARASMLFSPLDFTGDARTDVLRVTPTGDLLLYRGSGTGALGAATKIGGGWGGFINVFSPGDFTGDRKSDILAVKANGDLYLYRGNGMGGFTGSGTKIGVGWQNLSTMFSPGDFTGDGKSDVMGVNGATGDLYLYRGNGAGGWAASGQKIGNGWQSLQVMFSPRDFTGDGKSDVMGVNRATGTLTLYTGNGKGGWLRSGIKVGQGWGGMAAMFSPADFTGDRKSDVLGTTPSGDLYLYRGNGTGGWIGTSQRIATGMS